MKQIIFIIGLERSGTTWLAYYFSQIENIKMKNEFKVLPAIFQAYKYLQQYKNYEEVIQQAIVNWRQFIINMYDCNERQEIIIDKHTLNLEQNIEYLLFLQMLFPEARFVFIKRDNRNIVKSMMQKIWGTSKKESKHKKTLNECIEQVNVVNTNIMRWVKENTSIIKYEYMLNGLLEGSDVCHLMGLIEINREFDLKQPNTYKDYFSKKQMKIINKDLIID